MYIILVTNYLFVVQSCVLTDKNWYIFISIFDMSKFSRVLNFCLFCVDKWQVWWNYYFFSRNLWRLYRKRKIVTEIFVIFTVWIRKFCFVKMYYQISRSYYNFLQYVEELSNETTLKGIRSFDFTLYFIHTLLKSELADRLDTFIRVFWNLTDWKRLLMPNPMTYSKNF